MCWPLGLWHVITGAEAGMEPPRAGHPALVRVTTQARPCAPPDVEQAEIEAREPGATRWRKTSTTRGACDHDQRSPDRCPIILCIVTSRIWTFMLPLSSGGRRRAARRHLASCA